MNYYKNDIRHIQGNTYSSSLQFDGLGQNPESISFICRDTENENGEVLFQKTLGEGISLVEYDQEQDIRVYTIRIAPEDTEEIQTGTYYYSLKFEVNDDRFTIMKGRFIIETDA